MPPRHSSSAPSHLVFINVPFDKEYEPLYLALIAGLVRLDLRPRCVVEIPAQRVRLTRIFKLIKRCGSSIHDLSRVELSEGCPRFNMPFEAGLAVAWAQMAGKSHRWWLLEKVNHRLERTLNDLNGFDPLIHDGTQKGLLATLPNMFLPKKGPGPWPSVPELLACTKSLSATAEELKQEMGKDDLFQPAAFRKLAMAAGEIAERSRKGLLAPA